MAGHVTADWLLFVANCEPGEMISLCDKKKLSGDFTAIFSVLT